MATVGSDGKYYLSGEEIRELIRIEAPPKSELYEYGMTMAAMIDGGLMVAFADDQYMLGGFDDVLFSLTEAGRDWNRRKDN